MSKKAWIGEQIYDITGEGFTPQGKITAVEALDSKEGSVIEAASVTQSEDPTLCKYYFTPIF